MSPCPFLLHAHLEIFLTSYCVGMWWRSGQFHVVRALHFNRGDFHEGSLAMLDVLRVLAVCLFY